LLNAIARFISVMNGNGKKSQIAAGFAWGLLLGLIPTGSFFWIVFFIISFFFNHNHASKILCMAFIIVLSPIIAPAVDAFGWEVLHIEALQPLFTNMYNMPFVPFTKFNNTLVMGGLIGGALLWLPSFLIFMALIPLYRKYVATKIRESKIVKKILNSPLFNVIDSAVSSK